jgi:hypothetical protein
MTKWQRLKYKLACKLMGFDIYGAIEVARVQGARAGQANMIRDIAEGLRRGADK